MALQSRLFRGDTRLNDCLIDDPAHVAPGARGDHVAKIQTALNTIEDAGLKVDGVYGQATATAVKTYKNLPSRRILQPWQTTADDIVGKRTIAFLDRDMLAREIVPPTAFNITIVRPVARPASPIVARPRLALGFAFRDQMILGNASPIGTSNPPAPTLKLRLSPRHTGELLVTGAGGAGS